LLGTIVNTAAIIGGSTLGIILKGGIPEKYMNTVMQSISLAVIFIGLKGAMRIEDTNDLLLVIFSLAIGSLIGEFLKIEERLEKTAKWIESRFSVAGGGGSISKGFVTASLVFCVGAMAIVGSLESGLNGDHQTLYAKSVLDGISSIVFASSLGIGVIFSAVSVFLYQGLITLTASLIKPFLVPSVVSQMSVTGGLLIMGIGINLLELKRVKVGNMLPAVFVPLIYFMIKQLFTF